MSTWTEQQGTISIAERSAIRIGCNGIGRRLLLREGDVVGNAILLSIHVGLLGYLLLEQFHVLVRNGEMHVGLAISGSIECTFDQVFLHRSTRTLRIVVEQEQALRQLTIVQSFSLQHVGSNSLEVTLLNQRLDALAIVLLANSIQLTIEGKLVDIVKILLLKVRCGFVVIGIHESEHILEHTACCT